jgi:hypothetical protein
MTDESKLRKQQERGDRAKRLLENELLVEAFEKIEADILDKWQNSAADEKEQRDNAYLMHRLLQNLKAQIKQIVITGDGATKELLRLNDPSKIRRLING